MKKPTTIALAAQRTNRARIIGVLIAALAILAVIPFRDAITGSSSSSGTFSILAVGYAALAAFIIGLKLYTRRTKSTASLVSARSDNPAIVWVGVPIVILIIALGAWSVAG